MTLVRWSSDNFKCDLLIYKSDQGWEVHVAATRVLGDIPQVPHFSQEQMEEATNSGKRDSGCSCDICRAENESGPEAFFKKYFEQNKRQSEFMKTAKHGPIGLPCDGKIFVEKTLDDLISRVKSLGAMGYVFPTYLFKDIDYEKKEGGG